MSELDARAAEIKRAEDVAATLHHPLDNVVEITQPKWPPPLATEAYHGVVGKLVRAMELHTEADPVALLVQMLIAAGNAIGRGPHCTAEADRHGLNLFAVFVGETAKGRKGTSWAYARRCVSDSERSWPERIASGLSSGEGLIWPVRDPIERYVYNKDTGEQELQVVDPGVEDKRLLVFEGEFASTLRVLSRQGNTLSALIRLAWDTGYLQTLTKNSPARATGAHISIIGHVTKDELLRYLDCTEQGNGFGNRFLWFAVRRARVLPEGGNFDWTAHAPLLAELQDVIDLARQQGDHGGPRFRDDDARALWREVYPQLSEGKPGMLGAMLARGEAQVLRLSTLYAVLDRSQRVRREHLAAALALWRYAEKSAEWIFGDAIGDPIADTIYEAVSRALRGLTLTQIRDLFSRHVATNKLHHALGQLARYGRVSIVEEKKPGGGRPTTRVLARKRAKRGGERTEENQG